MRDKTITVKISGGLGNQMFEYAYAKHLQLEYDADLKLDVLDYEKRDKRSFSLEKCNIKDYSIADRKDSRFYRLSINLFHTFPNMVYNFYRHFQTIYWYTAKYKKVTLPKKWNNLYLFGYWQSAEYFDRHRKEIITELRIKDAPSTSNQSLIDRIRSTNGVCVHIRRGDYIKLGWALCDNNYYRNAMNIMREKLENPVFYIFSDDIAGVKAEYDLGDDVVYIEQDNPDYEELRLMYSCNHFIMANSSFSWWAQYLSYNEQDKVVIAPDIWLAQTPPEHFAHIYQDSWIKIPHN